MNRIRLPEKIVILFDLDNLLEPDVLAGDIIENLQSALEGFQALQSKLSKKSQ